MTPLTMALTEAKQVVAHKVQARPRSRWPAPCCCGSSSSSSSLSSSCDYSYESKVATIARGETTKLPKEQQHGVGG